MSFIKPLILTIFVIIPLFVSCKNGNGNKAVIAQKKEIKMIEIPKMITDPILINRYAVEHYWDNFDFGDSTLISMTDEINNHIGTYMYILASAEPETAVKSLIDFTGKFLNANKVLKEYFLKYAEDILYNPNSQMRNEQMYITVLETILSSGKVDPLLEDRYAAQLELALKNRPGNRAADFIYTDSKGKENSLYRTRGKYILLFFFEPECHTCAEVKASIINSPLFAQMGNTITYLAVYTGTDYESWARNFNTFPDNWIVSHDIDQELLQNKIYDLRASPTMYLLDEKNIVLMKDPNLYQLENYLTSLVK